MASHRGDDGRPISGAVARQSATNQRIDRADGQPMRNRVVASMTDLRSLGFGGQYASKLSTYDKVTRFRFSRVPAINHYLTKFIIENPDYNVAILASADEELGQREDIPSHGRDLSS